MIKKRAICIYYMGCLAYCGSMSFAIANELPIIQPIDSMTPATHSTTNSSDATLRYARAIIVPKTTSTSNKKLETKNNTHDNQQQYHSPIKQPDEKTFFYLPRL